MERFNSIHSVRPVPRSGSFASMRLLKSINRYNRPSGANYCYEVEIGELERLLRLIIIGSESLL